MPPRISIVMPCLNSSEHIQTAIMSVLAQTMKDFELIVVDNGSTDRTPDIVESTDDSRIRLLHQPTLGVSRARNMGLEAARSPLIAFLDSDDTWHPDFLRRMSDELARHPGAALAYCGWQNVGLPGPRNDPFIPPDYETGSKAINLLEGCRWPIHACLTYRELITRAGGFDTTLRVGEDYLLWMEISALGRIVRVPEVLARYYHHDGVQATKDRARASIDTFRAKKIFLERHPEIANEDKADEIVRRTWGTLIRDANALYWSGDLDGARTIFRKVLFSGHGTLNDKLRMLPSILPRWMHEAIFRARESLTGK